MFPADYKRFVEAYGQGRVGFLWFPSPFGADYEAHVEWRLNVLRGEQAYFEQDSSQGLEVPYPLYPELDGLLLITSSKNDDSVWFLPAASGNAIVVVDDDHSAFHSVPCDNLVDYILNFLGKKSQLFPGNHGHDNLSPFVFQSDPKPVTMSRDVFVLDSDELEPSDEIVHAQEYAKSRGIKECCRIMAECGVDQRQAWQWVQAHFRGWRKRDFAALYHEAKFGRKTS